MTDATTPKRPRRTRSWKTEAQNWEANYNQLAWWELKAVLAAALMGLSVGLALGAWIW